MSECECVIVGQLSHRCMLGIVSSAEGASQSELILLRGRVASPTVGADYCCQSGRSAAALKRRLQRAWRHRSDTALSR